MPERDYSHRALIDKLNVKEGARVLALGIRDADLMTELRTRTGSSPVEYGEADVILLSVESVADLQKIEPLRRRLAPAGGLWVVYPKGRKDIRESQVMGAGLAAGLVDNKVVGFSATHTGLRFVIPKADRARVKGKRG